MPGRRVTPASAKSTGALIKHTSAMLLVVVYGEQLSFDDFAQVLMYQRTKNLDNFEKPRYPMWCDYTNKHLIREISDVVI